MKSGSDKMHVSLNIKQKIAIVALIILMSIIATILVKPINQENPKTVSKTAEATATVTKKPKKTVTETPIATVTKYFPPKETSIPEPTESKEITKSNEKTEVEFETIKHLSDIYPLKFSFKSDVIYNRIEEEIGDVYIIEGRDDGISGHHDHDYLYGVNKHTGQKIWSFYGNYLGTPYFISEDEKYIIVLNLFKQYGKCFEIQTGTVIWEKSFSGGGYSGDLFNEFNKVFIVKCNDELVAVNKENWKNIWDIVVSENSYKFSEDERYVYYFDPNDLKTKCLEINTGKIIWEKEIDSSSDFEVTFNNSFLNKELFVIFSKKRIIAFNTADGNIVWEREFEKETKDWYKPFSFDYSIYNDLFILKYDDNLTAIDAKDGELLWDTPIKEVENYYYTCEVYKTFFNNMEIFVLLGYDDIYAIDTGTGVIISEFHEEGIADYIHNVEIEDNILYLYSRYLDTDDKSINLETGEIEYIPIIISEELYFLKELLTGKNYYDGIGILPGYDSNLKKMNLQGKDENGYVKWVFNYESYDSCFFNYEHSTIRIENKIYLDYEGAIVCIDALTGKVIFKLGKYNSYCSEIEELSDGTYWVIGNNNNLDVYKID